jgi:hypothetical protein
MNPIAEPSLLEPVTQDPFADLSFPDFRGKGRGEQCLYLSLSLSTVTVTGEQYIRYTVNSIASGFGPVDNTFEDFDLEDLDLDVDFDLDLFAPDGQHSPLPPLATSSSSAASPEGGSSPSGAGGDGGLRNEVSSESFSRSATGKDSCCKGKGGGAEEDEARRCATARARTCRGRGRNSTLRSWRGR